MSKFKITKPEVPVSREEVRNNNNRMFNEDSQKNGILAKTLVFTQEEEPVGAYELQILLQKYYKVEYDKTSVSRALKKLNNLGLLHGITSGELMTMEDNEMLPIHRHAFAKFRKYLEHIPKQFHRQYTGVFYYWVSNGDGQDYLEWCCRLLGFQIEQEKNETKTKS